GCRACETACPSGVNFGRLLEQARDTIYQDNEQTMTEKMLRGTFFNHVFPKQRRMVSLTSLVGLYQRTGLQKIARGSGIMKIFPDSMASMEKVLPEVPKKKQMKRRPTHLESIKPKKKKVAFFSGCLMDTIFMKTNDATTTLLQHAGCEIVIPETQGCCGALHGHSGEHSKAREMAKMKIRDFVDAEVHYNITKAKARATFLVNYNQLLNDDP